MSLHCIYILAIFIFGVDVSDLNLQGGILEKSTSSNQIWKTRGIKKSLWGRGCEGVNPKHPNPFTFLNGTVLRNAVYRNTPLWIYSITHHEKFIKFLICTARTNHVLSSNTLLLTATRLKEIIFYLWKLKSHFKHQSLDARLEFDKITDFLLIYLFLNWSKTIRKSGIQ